MSVDDGIQSLRPKIIRRKTKVKVIKETNQRRVFTVDEEQSVECYKKVGKLESQEGLSLSLQVVKENRETIYRDILKSRKSMRCGAFWEMERVEKRVVMRKGYTLALTAEGGKLLKNIWKVSGADGRIDRCQGEEQTVVLSGSAESVAKAEQMLGEFIEKLIERKLVMIKGYTCALTAEGGKLMKNIGKDSGAFVQIIPSQGEEQTVVLRGSVESVAKAEQMMEEFQSSALKIPLSGDMKDALLIGGKQCILNQIREKLQVSVFLLISGKTLYLVGKQEDSKIVRKVIEEELTLVKRILDSQ